MDINNFLDLWDIFVNELFGNVWLFIVVALVIIWYLAAKHKLSTEASLVLSVLFLSIIFARSNLIILWVFIVLGVGAMFYYFYQKTIRQG